MQTFLPYADFKKTFKCLDYRRLGKQRLEARYIWNIITNNTDKKGYRNHPAIKQWHKYENLLALYHNLCIEEWIIRGYKNNMELLPTNNSLDIPWWLGLDEFHSSHRQTLLFKNQEWYSQFKWKEDSKYEYFWPSKQKEITRTIT